MNKQLLIDQLAAFGLDEVEAQIYLYLIENGPRTALQLSREINVDRSKIYRSVERLGGKKFIEQTHAAWGKKLQAASPSNIELMIKEQEDQLQTRKEGLPALIEELGKVTSYAKREFEVKHYRGQEGLRQMLWNHLAANKEILAFSYKNKNDIVGKTYAEKIRAEQVARKLTLYEVENETDQNDYWYTDAEGWEKYYKSRYIPQKSLDIKQYIAIYNHTVSIINWLDEEEVGLEIINEDYADMQKKLFWQSWELAGKTPAKKKTPAQSKK
ncbi:MAG TPA: helix-turn-helix domain-containing protein [Candidatus Saccharimonadales bacterium]|nr:helix-turn-helix domain-containing protein [Candidatus Saccharimonadales bacterium]